MTGRIWEGYETTAQEAKAKLHEIYHTRKPLQGNKNNQQNLRIICNSGRFIKHTSDKELILRIWK